MTQTLQARIATSTPAYFQIEGQELVEATVRDMRLGTLFIETSAVQPVGQWLELNIAFPQLAQELVLPVTVRWQQADGMGVQIASLGVKMTRAVLALVQAQAEARRLERAEPAASQNPSSVVVAVA